MMRKTEKKKIVFARVDIAQGLCSGDLSPDWGVEAAGEISLSANHGMTTPL